MTLATATALCFPVVRPPSVRSSGRPTLVNVRHIVWPKNLKHVHVYNHKVQKPFIKIPSTSSLHILWNISRLHVNWNSKRIKYICLRYFSRFCMTTCSVNVWLTCVNVCFVCITLPQAWQKQQQQQQQLCKECWCFCAIMSNNLLAWKGTFTLSVTFLDFLVKLCETEFCLERQLLSIKKCKTAVLNEFKPCCNVFYYAKERKKRTKDFFFCLLYFSTVKKKKQK